MQAEVHQAKPKGVIKTSIILGIPVLILFIFNYSSYEIQIHGVSIKKIDATNLTDDSHNEYAINDTDESAESVIPWLQVLQSETRDKSSSAVKIPYKLQTHILPDSVTINSSIDSINTYQKDAGEVRLIFNQDTTAQTAIEKTDSSQQRVILIGDSEAGGLLSQFNDYCTENNHKLVATMIWYSAGIYNYGYSKRVDELIEKYQPTLIVIVLGLNEMYATDLMKRTEAAKMLRAKLGNIPYLWVGPANYTKDKGINMVFEQTATTERFFPSMNLNLPKGADNRHPNHEGYKIWMQHIARFIQSSALYNFKFDAPKKFGHRITGKVLHYNAAKDRGY